MSLGSGTPDVAMAAPAELHSRQHKRCWASEQVQRGVAQKELLAKVTDRVVDVVKEWEREAGAYEGVSTKVELSPYTTREDLPP